MKDELNAVRAVFENVKKAIYGKDEQIKLVLATWLSGGHVLIEDIPGTGKTVLAKALARSTNVDFGRVQFTPDLLPTDILGTSIYLEDKRQFTFCKGPIFSTCFLADEINRATPRTQAALLECMAEKQVTMEKITHELDPLFIVLATQNPIEHHGTFVLPEAQLDRFSICLSMGYPSLTNEVKMLKSQNSEDPLLLLKPVATRDGLLRAKKIIPAIKVSDPIYEYVMKIITQIRTCRDLSLGASPRGSSALIKTAQALAFLDGVPYVNPGHIYQLALPVLAHRLILTAEAKFAKKTAQQIVEDVLKKIKAPTE